MSETVLGLLDSEDEGYTLLRNVDNYVEADRASYPRTLENNDTAVRVSNF